MEGELGEKLTRRGSAEAGMRYARHIASFCLLSNDVGVGRQIDPKLPARRTTFHRAFGYLTCSKACISHAAVPLPLGGPKFLMEWLSLLRHRSEFSWWICVAFRGRATFRNRQGSTYSTHLLHMQFFFSQAEAAYE